jgi:colanic acid biosynthesis glycosyl transferase WcaI
MGPLQLTNLGIIKPSQECITFPLYISSKNFFVKLLNIILSFPVAFIIILLKPKVVLVSIPDASLVLSSYIGCKLANSKLIIDIRDPQEELMIHTYRNGLTGFISKIYKQVNYSIYRRAYAIIGVTQTIVNMLTRETGRIVYLIPNGADLYIFKQIDIKEARKMLGLSQSSFLIAYIGGLSLGGYYDILPILMIVRKIRRILGLDVRLMIAGPLLDNVIKMIIEMFKDITYYLGIIDEKNIVKLLSACNIGIIPRIKDPIYNYAIPAKFYEYVALGLPLIVTANKESELAKIIEENKLGFVCEPGDQKCLERAITTFAMNKSILDEYKKNVLVFRRHIDRRIYAERLYKLISKFIEVK